MGWRRHGELDKATAARCLEEAELWSKLMKVEHRLRYGELDGLVLLLSLGAAL
jgi:hypothetical protein